MKARFLTEPALLLGKTLIIADLHIGIEYEIYKSGISIPSQLDKLKKRIFSLIKKTKAKELIILGDIKHQVPNISWQESKEIPAFLNSISRKVKVSIVKGNHDGDIEALVNKKIRIYNPKGFRIKDHAFCHGQAWFDEDCLKAKHLVIAHVHPAIEFWMRGYRSVEHCWLKCSIWNKKIEKKYKKKANLEDCIIMPVFNPIIGGMPFNSRDFKPLGPILKNILNWGESEIYLLDGTFLGLLNRLDRT